MSRSRCPISVLLVMPTLNLAGCGSGDDGRMLGPYGAGGGHSVSGTGGRSSGGSTALGTGGTAAPSCELGGDIIEDTTWAPDTQCPNGYDVIYSVRVSGAGTKLVIEPGTKLKFASGTVLEVTNSASLVAVGTHDDPITFTGWQPSPGSWGGILIRSGSVNNEISHAIIEYGGQSDSVSANLAVWHESQPAQLKLSNTRVRFSKQFGLTISSRATLAVYANNIVTNNGGGAVRVAAASVHQLRGSNNTLAENGKGNTVRIEVGTVSGDVTWPSVSPATYRVTGTNGEGGGQIDVHDHLTIEPGAAFEFVGGSGIDVSEGTSGLSAVGTPDAPIVFRGVDGSGWTGIGFCDTSWSGNALEEVLIANAVGPTHAAGFCAIGRSDAHASVLVGRLLSTSAVRMKNVRFSGPNGGDPDIQVTSPSKLTTEGTNTGTGPNGELLVEGL